MLRSHFYTRIYLFEYTNGYIQIYRKTVHNTSFLASEMEMLNGLLLNIQKWGKRPTTAQIFCRPVFKKRKYLATWLVSLRDIKSSSHKAKISHGLDHFIKNKIEFIRVLSQSNMSRFRFKSDTDTKPDANWDANFNWIQIGYKFDTNWRSNRIAIGLRSDFDAYYGNSIMPILLEWKINILKTMGAKSLIKKN